MSLADPQSVTVSGAAKSMARIKTGDLSALYANQDSTYKLDVSHTETRAARLRHSVDFVVTKNATDPYTAEVRSVDMTIRLLIDRAPIGFTQADVIAHVAAFKAWLTETADTGIVARLYGKES